MPVSRQTLNALSALRWMIARLQADRAAYEDSAGCCEFTKLVEDYDRECLSGSATTDPDHPAWDAALKAAERVGGFNE